MQNTDGASSEVVPRRKRSKPRASAGSKAAAKAQDNQAKNRIRKIPEFHEFYKTVFRFHLREEAFKLVVLHLAGEEKSRKLRKMLSAPTAASA
jgi:hypothetical protein